MPTPMDKRSTPKRTDRRSTNRSRTPGKNPVTYAVTPNPAMANRIEAYAARHSCSFPEAIQRALIAGMWFFDAMQKAGMVISDQAAGSEPTDIALSDYTFMLVHKPTEKVYVFDGSAEPPVAPTAPTAPGSADDPRAPLPFPTIGRVSQ